MPLLRAGAVIGALLALLAEAAPDPAAQLFDPAAAPTAALRSYSFGVHIDVAMRSFPFFAFHLDGEGTYRRPALYDVHFKHVPWFAGTYTAVKMDALVPATWPATYDVVSIAHDGDRAIVELRDKTAGHVAAMHAELDADGLREVTWSYLNGGKISVTLTPELVEGVPLPQTEDADIDLPGYHLTAHAVFDDYRLERDD